MKLYIDAHRDGYGPDQCGRTMKVCELISYLEQFDADTPVYLRFDNGYTYGPIREHDFSDDESDGDE